MLEMAKDATMSVGEIAGLLMDELASLVLTEPLDQKLVEWIGEMMSETFCFDYTYDTVEEGYFLN